MTCPHAKQTWGEREGLLPCADPTCPRGAPGRNMNCSEVRPCGRRVDYVYERGVVFLLGGAGTAWYWRLVSTSYPPPFQPIRERA